MIRDQFTENQVIDLVFNCGIPDPLNRQLENYSEFAPGAKAIMVKRYGADVWVILQPLPGREEIRDSGTLSFRIVIGFLPKVGLAALFRRLLSMNVVTSRPRLALSDHDNSVSLVEGVRLGVGSYTEAYGGDFLPQLDAIVAAYHEYAPQLVKEFGLLQQSSSVLVDPTT